MPLADDVDLDDLAERTDRFTGADLEDLVRRAGLVALRKSLATETVKMADFDAALHEPRASVTRDMAQESDQMADNQTQAAAAIQPIGLPTPGTNGKGSG